MESKLKPEDLRINNWVIIDNRPVKVESISESGINIQAVGGYYAGEASTECEGYFEKWAKHIPQIEPISLTADILEKCGFEYDKIDRVEFYYFQISPDEKFMSNETGVYYGIQGVSQHHWVKQPCKYIHQLQNLYYALTGNELQITL